MAQEGWICPKCGKVHAPWVSSCECSDKMKTLTINTKDTCVDITEYQNLMKQIQQPHK